MEEGGYISYFSLVPVDILYLVGQFFGPDEFCGLELFEEYRRLDVNSPLYLSIFYNYIDDDISKYMIDNKCETYKDAILSFMKTVNTNNYCELVHKHPKYISHLFQHGDVPPQIKVISHMCNVLKNGELSGEDIDDAFDNAIGHLYPLLKIRYRYTLYLLVGVSPLKDETSMELVSKRVVALNRDNAEFTEKNNIDHQNAVYKCIDILIDKELENVKSQYTKIIRKNEFDNLNTELTVNSINDLQINTNYDLNSESNIDILEQLTTQNNKTSKHSPINPKWQPTNSIARSKSGKRKKEKNLNMFKINSDVENDAIYDDLLDSL